MLTYLHNIPLEEEKHVLHAKTTIVVPAWSVMGQRTREGGLGQRRRRIVFVRMGESFTG